MIHRPDSEKPSQGDATADATADATGCPKNQTKWIWLVVCVPLWKILVSWDDYSQYMENKKCSKPPTRDGSGEKQTDSDGSLMIMESGSWMPKKSKPQKMDGEFEFGLFEWGRQLGIETPGCQPSNPPDSAVETGLRCQNVETKRDKTYCLDIYTLNIYNE